MQILPRTRSPKDGSVPSNTEVSGNCLALVPDSTQPPAEICTRVQRSNQNAILDKLSITLSSASSFSRPPSSGGDGSRFAERTREVPLLSIKAPRSDRQLGRAYRSLRSKAGQVRFKVLSRETLHEFHQAAQSDAGRPLRDPWLLIFHPRGTGDIKVDPRRVLGKFFQEHGGGDGSAPASARVDDVGDAGANLFFVFVVERHAPHFF